MEIVIIMGEIASITMLIAGISMMIIGLMLVIDEFIDYLKFNKRNECNSCYKKTKIFGLVIKDKRVCAECLLKVLSKSEITTKKLTKFIGSVKEKNTRFASAYFIYFA